jgi:hypothetical protein
MITERHTCTYTCDACGAVEVIDVDVPFGGVCPKPDFYKNFCMVYGRYYCKKHKVSVSVDGGKYKGFDVKPIG